LGLFMMHYVNRSVIYPLQMRGGKPTPCIVMLMAWTFCVLNGFMQSRMLTVPLVVPVCVCPPARLCVGPRAWVRVCSVSSWPGDVVVD